MADTERLGKLTALVSQSGANSSQSATGLS